MALSLMCKHCDEVITGEDEDEFVARVQEHVGDHARAHGREHTVSREQVLTRLRRQDIEQAELGD